MGSKIGHWNWELGWTSAMTLCLADALVSATVLQDLQQAIWWKGVGLHDLVAWGGLPDALYQSPQDMVPPQYKHWILILTMYPCNFLTVRVLDTGRKEAEFCMGFCESMHNILHCHPLKLHSIHPLLQSMHY